MSISCIRSVLAWRCWNPATPQHQRCPGSQPHTSLESAPFALQALLDSSNKGEEGGPRCKLLWKQACLQSTSAIQVALWQEADQRVAMM